MKSPIIFASCTTSFFLLFLFFSTAALAQEPAASFDELRLLLESGDKITLTDPSGKNISGRVQRLAPDTLEMTVNGNVRTFKESDIRQITRRKPDSPLNGFLIGAGVGFGATLPVNLAMAEVDRGLALASSAGWALIGGGIGALVDIFVQDKQTVYFRPGSRASWSVRPFYSNSSRGVAVALCF